MLARGIRRFFKLLFTRRVKQEPGEESDCSRGLISYTITEFCVTSSLGLHH